MTAACNLYHTLYYIIVSVLYFMPDELKISHILTSVQLRYASRGKKHVLYKYSWAACLLYCSQSFDVLLWCVDFLTGAFVVASGPKPLKLTPP